MTLSTDITTIPTSELLDDRKASIYDTLLCEAAIALDVDYPKAQKRMLGNQTIIAIIDAELARRGIRLAQGQEVKI
jgi:hypothetical protein